MLRQEQSGHSALYLLTKLLVLGRTCKSIRP